MSIVFDTVRPAFDRGDAPAVDYPWDSWRSTSYFMFVDERLAALLETLSDAARTAFVLANAEWVCARHFRERRSFEVLRYVDSVWAESLTGTSVPYQEFSLEAWPGPILEPLCFAQLIVAAEQFEHRHLGATLVRASWVRNLALHVIGEAERSIFDRWTEESLSVLGRSHANQAPRWNSIFDAEFSNVDRCAPNALVAPDRYLRSEIDRYTAQHMARVVGSPYLAAPGAAS